MPRDAHRQLDAGPAGKVMAPHIHRGHHRAGLHLALRGLQPGDAVAVHQQPLDRHTLADIRPGALGGAGEPAGRQVGIGETGARLVADGVDVIQVQPGMQFQSFRLVDQPRLDADAGLMRDGAAYRLRRVPVGCYDHVAAADEAGRGLLIADQRLETLEHFQRGLGQCHVRRHGIMRAQQPAGLRRGATGDLLALEQGNAARPEAGQVEGDSGADGAAADYRDIVALAHRAAFFFSALAKPRQSSMIAVSTVRIGAA